MINPLQGSTITFSGFLKDDNREIITDLSPYVFRALIKSRFKPDVFVFSTASSGDTAITMSGTGLATWKLLPTQSKKLSGETLLELDVTENSTGDKKMGKTIIFCVDETIFSQQVNFEL